MGTSAPETAIGEAFRRAGVIGAAERLTKAAEDAVKESGGNYDDAVRRLLTSVCGDADLLWEMFAPFRTWVAREMIKKAAHALRKRGEFGSDHTSRDPPSGYVAADYVDGERRTGPRASDNHGIDAPVAPHSPNDRAEDHDGIDDQDRHAKSAVTPPSVAANCRREPVFQSSPADAAALDEKEDAMDGHSLPVALGIRAAPLRPPAKQPRGAGAIALAQPALRRSLLDTVMINGRPVGELTGREAREAAASLQKRGRFVGLLAHGVPDTLAIKDCKRPEDADNAMRLAEGWNEF